MSSAAILPGDPPLDVVLRRSARARRLSLRVSRLDARVTLTVPAALDKRTALAFLHEKEPWLRATLSTLPARVAVRPGVRVPVHGEPRLLRVASVPRVVAAPGALLLPPDPAGTRSGARVAAFLRAQARDDLTAACARHAAALGREFSAIALRDTRSRWGSCSAAGRLMFSWRLVMAPPQVLDYVAAHEVAHLAQMNHSPAYWAEVARLMPDHAAPRAWLRRHGAALHRFDFAATDAGGAGR